MILSKAKKLIAAAAVYALVSAAHGQACSQDTPNTDSFASQFAADTKTREKFEEGFSRWRSAVMAVQAAGVKFFSANSLDAAENARQDFQHLVDQGNREMELFIPLAIQLFDENGVHVWSIDMDPMPPQRDLDHLITKIQEHLFDQGQFEKAFELGTKLLANNPDNLPAAFIRGRAAMLTNRFSEVGNFAVKFSDRLDELSVEERFLLNNVDAMSAAFAAEQKIRDSESAADVLPRVQMKTTKGTVVFELFENQAPDTVANFISLVQSGFYDGLVFHRVIDRFVAQGGGETEGGQKKSPGYTIYDEFDRPDARGHFRGALSMAKTTSPNTSSSQFFVTLVPAPILNRRHTVFGRVLHGMDVFDRMNRTIKVEEDKEYNVEGIVKDKIISAKVIRQREHDYHPNKVR